MLNSPLVNYKSILINDKQISIGSEVKASYSSPFNKINVVFTPTNCSLSYYEVRVTRWEEEYDIGLGNRAYWNTNIELNKDHSFYIEITPDTFVLKEGETSATFRVSLYAKSSIDGSWDVSYFVFTLDGYQIYLQNGEALGVLTTREAPKN